MIFSGSLITIEKDALEPVQEFLSGYPQIEVYTISGDGRSLVVVIEEEDDKALEVLCDELKEAAHILDVAHHYFHFEDEVEKIQTTGAKPDLRGFGKGHARSSMNG